MFLLSLIVLAVQMPVNCQAASASGKVGTLIHLRMQDLGSTGSKLYNDISSGSARFLSSNWDSSNESATTWNEKGKTYAYVKFNRAGTYTVKFSLKYSFPGSTKSYSFSGSWTVTVENNGPTGVTVTSDKYSIYEGEEATVRASVSGGSESVTWIVSNNNVSYTTSGNYCYVTGRNGGSVRITARTSNGLSDYVNISVLERNTVTLSETNVSLNVGVSKSITATITGENSSTCTWKSENTSIVTLTSNGKTASLKGVAAGETWVRATAYDGTYARCKVVVTEPQVTDFEVNGIRYHVLSSENRTVAVAGLIDKTYSGKIDIPGSVTYGGRTYTVNSIRYSAFAYCKSLTSVTIPNTVTEISGNAFWDCAVLTSIEVNAKNPAYASKDGVLFNKNLFSR